MSTNCKIDYKLSDIIKEIRLIRKSVPATKVIIQWLRGTEFDTIDENGNDMGLKKVYDYKTYKRLKIFIDTAIKNKLAEKRSQNKQARVYLYLMQLLFLGHLLVYNLPLRFLLLVLVHLLNLLP